MHVLWVLIGVCFAAVALAADPINIGSRKQLFIDDRFIAESENVTLTMNPPRKAGIVLRGEHPWEEGWIGGGTTIIEDDGLCRMWYRAHEVGSRAKLGRQSLCYATSKDGIHWDKPKLGLAERDGSTDNNCLVPGGGTVFVDPQAPPEARYKLLHQLHWPDLERGGMYIYCSPDGLSWTLHPERLFPFCPDTTNHAFYDPRIDKFVAYVRTWSPWRKVGRVEMDDSLRPWPFTRSEKTRDIWGKDKVPVPSDEVHTAISYDDRDPEITDLYTPAVHIYPWADDAYFAFPSPYLHFPEPPEGKYGNDGLLDIQLAISRDGVDFERPFRQPYIGLGVDGESDSRCLYMAIGMIRRGDEIYQYYTGFFHSHGEYVNWPEHRGMGAIHRVVQRLDGFVSADAAYTGGELTTPPIVFEGERLELNVNASALGEVRVEIQDSDGKALQGFSAADCDPVHGNHVHEIISWQGDPDVSGLSGKPVQLRFVMRAAKLYGFRFLAAQD